MAKSKRKRIPKTVLKLPDLEQSKSAVLNSLTSASSKRSYDRAIREFIDWYCSEPRLAFNKTMVTRNWLRAEEGKKLLGAENADRTGDSPLPGDLSSSPTWPAGDCVCVCPSPWAKCSTNIDAIGHLFGPNPGLKGDVVANKRKIIVHIATSADGYIARPDGDIEWLTKRPAPKGFYGIGKFMNSIDTKLLGRKTYDLSVQMGATFDTQTPHCVFSRRPAPASVPAGVEFISEAIGAFAKRLRTGKGKDIWMMGGGETIASFLDEGAIDDFIISVIPTFIGEGIPLIAHRHRHVPLRLQSVRRFSDGVVQVHYKVQQTAG